MFDGITIKYRIEDFETWKNVNISFSLILILTTAKYKQKEG